ncbi:MAG: sugar phosphate isomerase/epimerase [Christensenellaceae bacterium]|jgi:sugar phosphate isomerase/epimerase|nr:sugar phosphate isomerase/epimerase [Christensenellaceae bacterium]
MFKISGFFDEASLSLDKQIKLAKYLNCSYMCPRVINKKNISEYSSEEFSSSVWKTLTDANIKFSSIGSPIGKISINDDEAYENQIKKLKELVKICNITECQYIRCFSFFDCDTQDESVFSRIVEKWKGFLSVVEGSNIILIHENEKKIYGDIPERVLKLYHALAHPKFKLCFDASNYIQCGVDPYLAYEMTKEFTVYYHMKDCDRGVEVPLGLGSGRIFEILKDLKLRNYDGFLTLEPHTAKYALLKRLIALIPFMAFSKFGRVFKKIDKSMGIRRFQKVTRWDVFVWQYEKLTSMLLNI